ncbi:sensor histidine kinase [Aliikangiella coralliicola]|uniref:histidine kinase n=1 Tax=Aliikangiella coralliicola TaxID=2592383 RepID=A0A545U8Y8_9GAMM|nr:HAMP domain-containing sensor histidine kinase [Aliikangiella coralliicola]TQV85928.1 HAMP domain-containing histidine kinase [Aliikangiella coralliicola]
MINTIKHRLFITFGSLAALICLLFTGVTWLFAAVTEDEVLRHLLTTEADYVLREYEKSNELKQARPDYMQVYLSKSALPAEVLQGYLDNPYEKEFYLHGDNYHIEEFATPEGQQFYITLNASKLEGLSTLDNMIWSFLFVVSGVVLILSLFLAWFLSNRSAKPLQQLSHQIEQHKFSEALPSLPTERRDEIGILSRSFESALQKISLLLEREREFTRDVSHELRTPMTLIKNTIQLSRQQPLKTEEIELIEHASNELEQTVDVLLALARQENLNFSKIKLTPILEKCVLKIYSVHPDVAFEVDIFVDDHFCVMGNQHLVNLLCQNLINNAFYHSNSSTMVIKAEGNLISFENALDGQQPKPFYQGLGHGHYLVKRIVEEMSWDIETEKRDDTYRVTITVRN